MKKNIFLIGSGGLGREIYATLKSCNFLANYNEIFFIDNHKGNINGIEIIGNNDYLKKINTEVDVIICISNPTIREKIIEEYKDFTNINFVNFIHPNAKIYAPSTVKIGKGCVILENSIITTDINIHDFCFLNIGVTLHHDTILEQNCFLMPGVRITGGATIGKNTYIGSNFSLSDSRTIKANSRLNLDL